MSTEHSENPQETFDLDKLAAEVEQIEEPQRKKPRRTALLIAGVAGLIVLLGAAAFVAFRLLRPEPTTQAGGPGGAGLFVSSGGPGGGSRSFKVDMTPAPELPTTQADVLGSYSRLDGNSLFIHQAVQGAMVGTGMQEDAGPEVEVVITSDTKLYKDATSLPEPDQVDGKATIQQAVEPIAKLENLSTQAHFMVWGERRGDRVIARVILYSEPIVKVMPKN